MQLAFIENQGPITNFNQSYQTQSSQFIKTDVKLRLEVEVKLRKKGTALDCN